MFCTTFYSYKGGVGRTLSLANVACVLAQQRKRVLVVDFDLEAPGLPTLPGFSVAADRPGIVDLVHEYLKSGSAPDVRAFVQSCEVVRHFHDDEVGMTTESLSIDVMPAGQDIDGGYADRLNAIDWNRIYLERDGFLLMEEIRAQWSRAGYDYVLIDSRTGLTDVGGICTRQLPDAVVAVFFPNEQNLVGLKQVVSGIREGGARPRPIELAFVASRVPRLDDEHGHLRRWLDRFQTDLDYDEGRLTTVQHYDSLMLLNQSLFVLDRPASSLAAEYRDIASTIAGLNDEDADGAVAFLNAFSKDRLRSRRDLGRTARFERIGAAHPEDFVVQFALARAYYSTRDLLKAEEACDRAINAEGRTRSNTRVASESLPSARRLRLRILSEQGRDAEALEDARSILRDAEAGRTSLVDAVLVVATADPAELTDPTSFPAIAAASSDQLVQLGEQLTAVEGMEQVSADIVEAAIRKSASDGADISAGDSNDAQLVLIAGGRFDRAIALVDDKEQTDSLHAEFNTAVALWGRDGSPDLKRWRHVADLFGRDQTLQHGANAQQCLALTHAVLGDVEAMRSAAAESRRLIGGRTRREFSCWSYSNVPPSVFKAHLDELEAFGSGEGRPPLVLSAHQERLSSEKVTA